MTPLVLGDRQPEPELPRSAHDQVPAEEQADAQPVELLAEQRHDGGQAGEHEGERRDEPGELELPGERRPGASVDGRVVAEQRQGDVDAVEEVEGGHGGLLGLRRRAG